MSATASLLWIAAFAALLAIEVGSPIDSIARKLSFVALLWSSGFYFGIMFTLRGPTR